MSPLHIRKSTRRQKWRIGIILVEIVVLLAALALSSLQASPTTLLSEQFNQNLAQDYHIVVADTADNVIGHSVAFYVDYDNHVRIIDNGVVQDISHFADCPTEFVSLEDEVFSLSNALYHPTHITLVTIRQGITFYTESYEIMVSERAVTIFTENGGQYQIVSNCND